jgi:hypothetical protein
VYEAKLEDALGTVAGAVVELSMLPDEERCIPVVFRVVEPKGSMYAALFGGF